MRAQHKLPPQNDGKKDLNSINTDLYAKTDKTFQPRKNV